MKDFRVVKKTMKFTNDSIRLWVIYIRWDSGLDIDALK
jgi:hypothetical protein